MINLRLNCMFYSGQNGGITYAERSDCLASGDGIGAQQDKLRGITGEGCPCVLALSDSAPSVPRHHQALWLHRGSGRASGLTSSWSSFVIKSSVPWPQAMCKNIWGSSPCRCRQRECTWGRITRFLPPPAHTENSRTFSLAFQLREFPHPFP